MPGAHLIAVAPVLRSVGGGGGMGTYIVIGRFIVVVPPPKLIVVLRPSFKIDCCCYFWESQTALRPATCVNRT